jgi:GNAT superfamily N-acetyltransferase
MEARVGARLVGVCGLNRDPYIQSPTLGRVRHLYVAPAFRRRGIGRLLVTKILECARPSFSRVRLRTSSAEADQFYRSLGFHHVEGEREATHAIEVRS